MIRPGGTAQPRVVALGGGHGLAATLSALAGLTDDLTAVVGVGDDGGSSGRLRRQLGALPPGDLRMALAAMATDDAVARLFQHRFDTGDLDGHPVGNLVLTGLEVTEGGIVAALQVAARLLGVRGQVLPVSEQPVQLCATVRRPDSHGGSPLRGQKAIASCGEPVERMWLDPMDPPACGAAVEAVEAAELVVLGPGSLFTSLLPHLLVPGMRQALLRTSAHRVLTMNLAAQAGETTGFSAAQHVAALLAHVPELTVETVLVDPATLDDPVGLGSVTADLGARLVVRPVAEQVGGRRTGRHDVALLRAAYRDLLPVDHAAGPAPTEHR